ncbi:MAG: mucoidy inhibitor MuiA family protein [Saprospiraceae bacterium]
MRKITLLLLLLCLSLNQIIGAEKEISSTIQKVTVFSKGAQVFRTAETNLPMGKSFLKFIGISPSIIQQSIQVKGKGNFTILSIKYQKNHFVAPKKSGEIESLQSKLTEIQEQVDRAGIRSQVLREEESLILANKAIGGQQNGVSIDELKAAAAFYRQRLLEIRLEKFDISKTVKGYNVEKTKISKQLNELNADQGVHTSEVVVAITAQQATMASFSLSYFVKEAGWTPSYDIRVKDIRNPIDLSYKANVFQKSGEDWSKVMLSLSTSNPTQGGQKPTLAPWLLDFYRPSYAYEKSSQISPFAGNRIKGKVTDNSGEELIGVSILVEGTSVGTTTDFEGNFTLDLPSNASNLIVSYLGMKSLTTAINASFMSIVLEDGGMLLDEVVIVAKNKRTSKKDREKAKLAATKPIPTTTKQNTISVTFEIAIPYSIANDGKSYLVDIKQHELPAYYEYYCAPKLDKNAFLTAQVTGWEDYNLLNGSVNLFFEGTYVGKSYLNAQNVQDTLSLSLGRDENIVIERTKLKAFSKKKFLSSKKVESRAWKIDIRNNKPQSINLVVQDQFPVSTNGAIEVKQGKYDGATLDETTGFLTWKIALAPKAQKQLGFDYAVRSPKKQKIQLE